MGLDWLPGKKPRAGSEAEFHALKTALGRWFCCRRKAKLARLEELTVQPWETLRAPIVGRDDRATKWARDNFEHRANRDLGLEAWLKQLDGLPVVELVDPCDGLPKFSNGGPGQYVGPESFRAQFLKDCVEIIGEKAYDEAFLEMAPSDCMTYGERLARSAMDFAEAKAIDVSRVDECEDPEAPEFGVSVVLSASKWCNFWGKNRHGLSPWF